MARRPIGLLGVLLLGALAAGQEPVQDDPATRYRNLTRAYGKAQREFAAAWRKKTEEARESGTKTLPALSFKELAAIEFKLPDYRGKVVLLDFWGFW